MSAKKVHQMSAGEVAAMIDIEGIEDAADRPGRIGLPPNCLAQREAGIESGRRPQEDHGAGDDTGIVVYHRCQQRASRLPSFIQNKQVEHRVVGLPDGIRSMGTMPMDYLIAIAEGCRTVMCQRYHCWIESGTV